VYGQYDAIASVEMVEAVGQEYWPDYLDCIARCNETRRSGGLQYIRIEDDIFEQYADGQDFIQRYIFPGGMLLSESRFRALAEARGLRWETSRIMALHYAETLRIWRERFEAAVAEGGLPAGFDEKFVALWRFYLMYCEGGFRGGGINVAQVTLIKSWSKTEAGRERDSHEKMDYRPSWSCGGGAWHRLAHDGQGYAQSGGQFADRSQRAVLVDPAARCRPSARWIGCRSLPRRTSSTLATRSIRCPKGELKIGYDVDAYMKAQRTAGLVIVHNGKIRLEKYGLDFDGNGKWTSFSVAKSLTSTMVGAAVKDGYIKSLMTR
jgi:hypothetical protein